MGKTAQEIGPYRLDALLGRGGMGEVYRAWDRRLERWVAVKRLRGDSSAPARRRFRREARAAARLGHPAVVQVFDILEEGGTDWIVLELVEGRDLATLLGYGPLDVDFVLDYGRQIAAGPAAAHAAGIVHRDLKTDNVMVQNAPEGSEGTAPGRTAPGRPAPGRIRILDFGLAQARRLDVGDGAPSTKTESMATLAGHVMGTPRAMSPEQARGQDLDFRCDLFALGVLLYELLTARSPFLAPTPIETLSRVMAHEPPDVRELDPRVPPPLAELIGHLLEKEPAHRPPGAAAVARALSEIASAGDATPRPEREAALRGGSGNGALKLAPSAPASERLPSIGSTGSTLESAPTTVLPRSIPGESPFRLRAWPPPELPKEPYPVLVPYTHPDLFAGRDFEIDDLVTDLRAPILITGLYAPSGTGKSSMLLGGLLPRLRDPGAALSLGGAGGVTPVAYARYPHEAGVVARLTGDLLEGVAIDDDDDHQAFVERLATVERLAGQPPLLVLDQFEEVLRPDAKVARARLGVLLAATARQRPGTDLPLCRWLLGYRKEYHGAMTAWLGDVLRDADATGVEELPHDLSGPDRFQDFPLSPLATPPAGSSDPLADSLRVFQDAIEKPLTLRRPPGEEGKNGQVYPWNFAPGHTERLARAFAETRLVRPGAPLGPELQVTLAHLLARAEPDGTVTVPPEPGQMIGEALEDHVRRALESAFPSATPNARTNGAALGRAQALLALRELATATGRRDDGLPTEQLARAIGAGGEEILAKLATPLTRLVGRYEADDGPRYVLSHDRLADVVIRMVEEEGRHGRLLVDTELLALRRFVSIETALHAGASTVATRIPRRHYQRIAAHSEALLWDDERRAWWSACGKRRQADLRQSAVLAMVALGFLVLLTSVIWKQVERRRHHADLLDQVREGGPGPALQALQELWQEPKTHRAELLALLRQRGVAMDVLAEGLGEIPEAQRGTVVLRAVDVALPWAEETSVGTPEYQVLVANLVWALDYGPGRDPPRAPRARALRDQVLEPLRKLRPPPTIGGDDPDWVLVPAGTVRIRNAADNGQSDQLSQPEVSVSAFRIQRHEVTNAEYRLLVPDHQGEDELPVAEVTWYAAYVYAAWLGGRLPTEAEWEHAALAGCSYAYCKQDGSEATLEEVSWTLQNATAASPVMTRMPNPWGIYDMIGNQWEWTADWYAGLSAEVPPDSSGTTPGRRDPWGPAASDNGRRVFRGGSWAQELDSLRDGSDPGGEFVYQGFRVLLPATRNPI